MVQRKKNKTKKKVFKDNEQYFEFYRKMKDSMEIISIKTLRNSIKIEYEDKEVKE